MRPAQPRPPYKPASAPTVACRMRRAMRRFSMVTHSRPEFVSRLNGPLPHAWLRKGKRNLRSMRRSKLFCQCLPPDAYLGVWAVGEVESWHRRQLASPAQPTAATPTDVMTPIRITEGALASGTAAPSQLVHETRQARNHTNHENRRNNANTTPGGRGDNNNYLSAVVAQRASGTKQCGRP